MNIDQTIRKAIKDNPNASTEHIVEKSITILELQNLTESRYAIIGQMRTHLSHLVHERTVQIQSVIR